MSLFPAYSQPSTSDNTNTANDNLSQPVTGTFDWLKNSSFVADSRLFPAFKDDQDLQTLLPDTESEKCAAKPEAKKADDYRIGSKKLKKKKKLVRYPDKRIEVKDSGSTKKIFLEDINPLSFRDVYRIDKKSDRTNLAFPSLAHNQIAQYRRKRPLYDKSSILKNGKKAKIARYFKHHQSDENSKTSRVISPKYSWEPKSLSLYLPLETPEPKPADAEDKTQATDSNDEVFNWKNDLNPLLNHGNLMKNPHDINSWLKFIKSQSSAKGFEKTKAAEGGILERQLAILDRCISLNPTSIQLLAYRLNLCKPIWESDKLEEEWKKILFIYPNNVHLWNERLNSILTTFSTFTTGKYLKMVSRCFKMLRKMLGENFKSHLPLPHMEEDMIGLFVKHCDILCACGYQEKALACYQALIEFNFNQPAIFDSTKVSFEEKLTFFEPFWDSSVPRFGQNGAMGWEATFNSKQFNVQTFDEDDEEEEKKRETEEDEAIRVSELKWRNWMRLERLRSENHWLPVNVNKNVEDSERIILVDDVNATLFNIKLQQNKLNLIMHFLRFLGVYYDSSDTVFSSYENVNAEVKELVNPTKRFNWKFYNGARSCEIIPLNPILIRSAKLNSMIENVFTLSLEYFKSQPKFHKMLTIMKIRWIIHTKDYSTSKKKVKEILRSEDSYDLWMEFVDLEIRNSKLEEVKKVFSVLMVSHKPLNIRDRPQAASILALYRKYIRFTLHNSFGEKEEQDVVNFIVKLIVKSEPSSTNILKTKSKLKTLLDDELRDLTPEEDLTTGLSYLLGVLLFLSESIKAAKNVFINVLNVLENSHENQTTNLDPLKLRLSRIREEAYESWVELEVVNNNTKAYSPITRLRDVLERALRNFPSNDYFNQLFLDIETKSHLNLNLLRHFSKEITSESAKPTIALYAVIAHLQIFNNIIKRSENEEPFAIGFTEKLRALFENCLKNESLSSCVVLWRLYLKFEAIRGNLKNCKSVFYRALQNCPWSKTLYMDAVEFFPEDVQELHDLMTEKGIRIMTPLDEVALLLQLKSKSTVIDEKVDSTEITG